MMNLIKQTAKNNNRSVFILSILLMILSLVCLIINYSIQNSISWALYPVGGLIVIWATTIPILIFEKYKVLGSLTGLTLTLIPFLFLIEYLAPIKGWFVPLALPISILSLLALGASLFALVNKQINKFYSVGITIFLFGIIVNIGVAVIIYNHLDENIIFDIYRITTISIALLLSLILFIMGYSKSISK
jgi:hypothetical protein